jgi:hypothetical protein
LYVIVLLVTNVVMAGGGSMTVMTELKDATVCELTYNAGVVKYLLHCLPDSD